MAEIVRCLRPEFVERFAPWRGRCRADSAGRRPALGPGPGLPAKDQPTYTPQEALSHCRLGENCPYGCKRALSRWEKETEKRTNNQKKKKKKKKVIEKEEAMLKSKKGSRRVSQKEY